MIIAQISDTHLALDVPDTDRRIRDFEATIADINALDQAPDVIVHTGDIVQNGLREEYQCAAKILQAANAPVHLMVGNKDNRVTLREQFPSLDRMLGKREFVSYVIDDFPIRLIFLDTLQTGSNKGDFCDKRMEDLDGLIGSKNTKPVVIFAHHPPFVVNEGPDPIHFESAQIMERFRQKLEGFDQIMAMVCGHVHRGVAGWLGEVPIHVMPSIATSLRRGEYPADMKQRPVYHIHRYDPVKGFSTEARIVNL